MNKKFTKLMAALALLTFLAVPMGMWGQTRDTKTDVMFAKGFAGYTTGSYSAAGTDRTAVANSTNATGVTYAMQVFNGSTGLIRGNKSGSENYSCRNTTTYNGYYISQVKLTIRSNSGDGTIDGSTSGRSVVYFGSSAYANPNTTAPSGTSTAASPASSGQHVLTWSNTDESVSYFILYNLKASGNAYSESANTALEIVWTQKTGPVIPSTTVTIDDTNLTNTDVHTGTSAGSLSATVKENTNNTTISGASVTWSSSNTDIATINENTGVVTLVAAGTTTITASYAGESGVYGASNATYDLEVTDSTPFPGGDVTFVVGTDQGTSTSSTDSDEMSKSGVTISSTKAAFAYTNYYRIYSGSSTTISTLNGTITKIVITGNDTGYPVSNLSVSNNGSYNVANNIGTWTGSSESVVFSASAQTRASQIVVTVTMPSTDPSISADDVNLAYNATSGSIDFEIENYEAGTMVATTTADWISNFNVDQIDEIGEVTFTVAPNTGAARTANVTLTYTYGDNQTATAEVAVGQAAVPSVTVTPDAVTVAASGDYPEFAISYESLEITSASNFEVVFFDATGTSPTTQPEWITDVEISAGTTGYELILLVDENTGSQRVAYLKIFAMDDNEVEKYSNLVTITQSAAAQTTIDLRGMTTALSFTPGSYSSLTNSYGDYTSVTYTGSNSVEYSGWNLYQVLKSSGNLQMKKEGAGYVEMPTILTDYGFTIIVTAVTNSVDVVLDEESGTNTLTTAETSADVVIQTGSVYAVISTITITPTSAPAEYTLTVSNLNHVNLFVFGGDESEALIEGGGEGTAQVYNGTNVEVSVDVENGYVLESLIVDGVNVTSQIDEITDMYVFTMPDHNVTITATAVLAPATDDYELFSGELVEGDYIIYYNGYVLKNTAVAVGTSRLGYETVTPSSSDIISTNDASIVWHIAQSGEYWTIYNAAENKYAASTGTKNQAQMLADGTDNKSLWTVTGSNAYEFVNKHNSANSINANLRNNGTNGWACYSSQTGGALSLYKKVEYTLTITGYGSSTTGGWYLIASPVAVNPANVEGMTIENSEDPNYSDFDLYYFDQTGGQNGKEWKNYKTNHFNLVPGTGYLYANKTGGNYTLAGTSYSGNGEVGLVYSEDNEDVNMRGWNLIGNPFNSDVTIVERDFYIMNDDHDQIILADANHKIIAPMQGIFVQAASVGESVTFTEVTQNANANSGTPALTMNLLKNRGNVIDRAIVRFGEGRQLSKLQLFENSTKLYFAQNNEEMAVVRSEAQGEMPVNFKAAENGTYTLTVNPEGVEMNYLHLIDNMTGADIDLLQTPSYTFSAATRDYESRFRLVFAASNSANADSEADNFAFFSNGSWIINNVGEATLQVVDVNGRILSTETVNGSVGTTINAASGVYMLRLINGENVKVQKIVVR